MGILMNRFRNVTRCWSTRRVAAVALLLAGVGAATILGVIAWLVPGETASPEAARGLVLHLAAGAVTFIALLAVIGVVLDRALAARAFDARDLPARPEFYDYATPELPLHMEEIAGRPLGSLTFTVFDTESTGLRPSQGDEIISIAGVRVRDGKVDRETVFKSLVNPGFSVPKPSIRFHGITDDMLEGAPPAAAVLPRFHGFVGDTILVAHNAAFDMRFLKLKEPAIGMTFDQIVLDTLLLSVFLDRDADAHTLDAIAARAGVTIEGRHTALGDALATAEIFLHMLGRLEDRGITSLDGAISVGNEMTAVRKLQNQF